jgi:hypothetical protein
MANINVSWGKLTTGNWCPLVTTDFSKLTGCGVYFIWGGGRAVKVGQSNDASGIGARIACHARDKDLLAYQQILGTLYVTWAYLPQQYLDGVERFLGDHYRPLVGDRFPNAVPISVNLP